MDIAGAIAQATHDFRRRNHMGDTFWYVQLPSWMERDTAKVKQTFRHLHEQGKLPPDLIGCQFAPGRNDPRPRQLRQITFEWAPRCWPPLPV